MSTGGIFNLITNDGKQDRMLMASELLSQRLAEIKVARQQNGEENVNPTLADIERTHVLFMNAHFKPFAAIAYEYNKVTANNPTLGSKVQFSIPQFGDFFSDMVVHVKFAAPTVSPSVNSSKPQEVAVYRWCDYPGERLFQKVSFDVNGNPLDEYYPDTYNFHRQFCVSASKEAAWNKCMGQEQPKDLVFDYVVNAAPQNNRASISLLNGHQTYKANGQHSDLELFVPLLFWFNTDPRLAIPSVAIPYGQRFINIDLATKEQMVDVRIPANTDAAVPTVTTPTITNFDLYINNIFVNPDIHDIFIARIGFTLVRVHRRQITNVNKSSDNVLLQQLKWPIETMYVGVRPTANSSAVASVTELYANPAALWHKFGQCTVTSVAAGSVSGVATAGKYMLETNHVHNISVSAHGVPLYNNLPSNFFNCYVPYMYGGWNISAPTDPGCFMINFCLYPGTYQPSGHINVSRAREFYLQYNSSYVSSNQPAELIVNAVAINFLLVSDGSATLRYAT